MDKPYVSLHNHTEYSLLDGACRIDELVELAAEYDMNALAITDHGAMFGTVPFYKACIAAGIKPIIGQEAYIAPGDMHDKKPVEGAPPAGYHLLLLVRNEKGYNNLLKISSAGFLDGFYYKPRVDKEFLAAHSEGLIASTACLKGEVPYKLLRNNPDGAKEALGELVDIFGKDNVYIEIMRHGLEEEKKLIPLLAGLSSETGIPLVATTDAHYIHPEDYEFHDLLLCMQTGKHIDEENRLRFSSNEMYFRSPDEMERLFADYPEALEKTREIASRIVFELPAGEPHLPEFPIPEKYEDDWDYIKKRTFEGLKRRYGELTDKIVERAEYELTVIKDMGFLSYYAIVADFTDAARERGVRVGPGRGSGASSIVAYALGITNIDPLRYGLLFERFLNPERISLPDFDIDFEDAGRDRVIDYVRDKYGEDSVAQIITFNYMKARGAIKDVGRVLNMPYDYVDTISKMVPYGISIKAALEQIPDLHSRYKKEPDIKKLLDYAMKLEGLPRHAGKHAAGVVITPGPLTDYVPLFRTNKNEITTQYDWVSVEEIGVVKTDFLGLKTLTVISETERMVFERTGEKLEVEKAPLDDEETFEMLSHGDTLGVFQFESEGMTKNLRNLHPDRIEDMIAMNALYRPGPMQFIDNYIARKHGTEKIEYPHESIKPILEETYGIVVYQEQVMQIAQAMAGFSLGQADILRRAMGKKKHAEMMAVREDFLAGAKKKGVKDDAAESVFDMMAKFAEYGFNKAHSVAYSVVAYQTAYLKAHHRLEFTAANMTNEIDNADKIADWIDDARRHGIEILPPDVNSSSAGFIVEGEAIRYGLAAVKNVGLGAAESIASVRDESGRFDNLYDFCERVDLGVVNRRALESLVAAGAFDSTGIERGAAMATIPEALAWAAKKSAQEVAGAAGDLFASEVSLEIYPEPPQVEPWTRQKTLSREKEALGLYLSGHPLSRYEDEIEAFVGQKIADIDSLGSGVQVTVAGMLTSLEKTMTKQKKPMAYGVIEDLSGSIKVVFFPETYAEYSELLEKNALYLVRGSYNIDNRGGKIVSDEIIPLGEAWKRLIGCIHIRLDADIAPEEIDESKDVLKRYPGDIPLKLHIVGKEHTYRAISTEFYNSGDRELVRALRELLGKENVWISA
ncbi:DNA polymerase III subunit alpha [bacterium]|nr:MAG: DNA polymerase III subunit alpha [bacterium]